MRETGSQTGRQTGRQTDRHRLKRRAIARERNATQRDPPARSSASTPSRRASLSRGAAHVPRARTGRTMKSTGCRWRTSRRSATTAATPASTRSVRVSRPPPAVWLRDARDIVACYMTLLCALLCSGVVPAMSRSVSRSPPAVFTRCPPRRPLLCLCDRLLLRWFDACHMMSCYIHVIPA